jgi:hypothetical protein
MADAGKLSLAELGRLCRQFLDRANGSVIQAATLAAEVNERILLGEAGSSYTFRDWYDAYCSSFPVCPPVDTFLLMGGWTTAKKREVAARLLKRDPLWSDRAIARDIGIDHKTVADVRRELEANGEVPHSEPPKGRTGPKRKPAAAKPQPTALTLEGDGPLIAAFNRMPKEERAAITVLKGRLKGVSKVLAVSGEPRDGAVTELKTTWLESRKRDRTAFTDAYDLARLKEQISHLPDALQVDLWNWLSDKLKATDQRCSIDNTRQIAELVAGTALVDTTG